MNHKAIRAAVEAFDAILKCHGEAWMREHGISKESLEWWKNYQALERTRRHLMDEAMRLALKKDGTLE